jgi:hypothetical protein
MWKNTVDWDRPEMTMWRMRIACWVPKATNTYSGCIILIASPLQQWLHERFSMCHAASASNWLVTCVGHFHNVVLPDGAMVGDSRHYTHECEAARNSTGRHGKLYAEREAGPYCIDSPNAGWDGRFGNGPAHTWLWYKGRTWDVYSRMSPSSLFQTMVPVKTSGDLVVLANVAFLWWINAGTYRYWTALTSCDGRGGRYIRTNMGCSWWETIWRCSNQA